jgi:hypothetical protein
MQQLLSKKLLRQQLCLGRHYLNNFFHWKNLDDRGQSRIIFRPSVTNEQLPLRVKKGQRIGFLVDVNGFDSSMIPIHLPVSGYLVKVNHHECSGNTTFAHLVKIQCHRPQESYSASSDISYIDTLINIVDDPFI